MGGKMEFWSFSPSPRAFSEVRGTRRSTSNVSTTTLTTLLRRATRRERAIFPIQSSHVLESANQRTNENKQASKQAKEPFGIFVWISLELKYCPAHNWFPGKS